MKKKKKKKTAFDLDAALAAEETAETSEVANEESTKDDLGDMDADLDLENFGKKKKKKKKPFVNLDDEASGSTEQRDGEAGEGEQGDAEVAGGEGLEFDFGTKKKKKKKKDLNDILKDEEEADKENGKLSSQFLCVFQKKITVTDFTCLTDFEPCENVEEIGICSVCFSTFVCKILSNAQF